MRVKTVVTGVGSRIVELIRAGELSNKEILARVRAEHPARKTTYACVAWYQSKLKKDALEVANEVAKISADAEVAAVKEAERIAAADAYLAAEIEAAAALKFEAEAAAKLAPKGRK
mgnify:CR=1 FL=1